MLTLDERDERIFTPLEHKLFEHLFELTDTPVRQTVEEFIAMLGRTASTVDVLGLPFTIRVTLAGEDRHKEYVIHPGPANEYDPAWVATFPVAQYTHRSSEDELPGHLIGDAALFLSAMTLVRTVLA